MRVSSVAFGRVNIQLASDFMPKVPMLRDIESIEIVGDGDEGIAVNGAPVGRSVASGMAVRRLAGGEAFAQNILHNAVDPTNATFERVAEVMGGGLTWLQKAFGLADSENPIRQFFSQATESADLTSSPRTRRFTITA